MRLKTLCTSPPFALLMIHTWSAALHHIIKLGVPSHVSQYIPRPSGQSRARLVDIKYSSGSLNNNCRQTKSSCCLFDMSITETYPPVLDAVLLLSLVTSELCDCWSRSFTQSRTSPSTIRRSCRVIQGVNRKPSMDLANLIRVYKMYSPLGSNRCSKSWPGFKFVRNRCNRTRVVALWCRSMIGSNNGANVVYDSASPAYTPARPWGGLDPWGKHTPARIISSMVMPFDVVRVRNSLYMDSVNIWRNKELFPWRDKLGKTSCGDSSSTDGVTVPVVPPQNA